MTNAELRAQARAMANCEHPDTADLLDALANALEEADKGTHQSVDLVIAQQARIATALIALDDMCEELIYRSLIKEFQPEIDKIRQALISTKEQS